jgi:hypothetical protein
MPPARPGLFQGARMRLTQLLLFAGMVGLSMYGWRQLHAPKPAADATMSDTGFVQTVNIDGAERNTVLILAPENCPSVQAQRASALAQELTRRGIPNHMGSEMSFSSDDPNDGPAIDRAVAVFNQGAPAVFINGMAKSNPTADEVAKEYARTRALKPGAGLN